MSDNVTAIKGFADLFSPDSDAFTHMEAVARETFSRYGFTELRTPILERTELFCRGIGTETDVVQKEMYTFPDRKGRSLTLRPEATAGVMRAYIESGRSGDAVTKLFTIGPMFRYERPQKGLLPKGDVVPVVHAFAVLPAVPPTARRCASGSPSWMSPPCARIAAAAW